jgi:hypothetical protein
LMHLHIRAPRGLDQRFLNELDETLADRCERTIGRGQDSCWHCGGRNVIQLACSEWRHNKTILNITNYISRTRCMDMKENRLQNDAE